MRVLLDLLVVVVEGEVDLKVALGLAALLYPFIVSYASYELQSIARRPETIQAGYCSLDC